MPGGETGLLFEEPLPQPLKWRGRIQIGTSGYSFDDWQGPFYPKGLQRGQWLSYYARHFSVVEINATYYRIPPPSTFQSMADRTPECFEFWVKLPGKVTHTSDDFSQDMKYFLTSVHPLTEANKLRGFLAQFPPSFRCTEQSLDKLSKLKAMVGDVDLAVEFRQKDWLRDETFAFLKEYGLIYVIVDLPSLPGLPEPEIHVTGSVTYVRFHGRNDRNWHNPRHGDRYDYEYSEAELNDWIPKIANMDSEGSTAYLFFNNCHAGQAVKNAKMLRQMLELEIN